MIIDCEQSLRCHRCGSEDYRLLKYGYMSEGGCVMSDEKPKYRCNKCNLGFGSLGLTNDELFNHYLSEIRRYIPLVTKINDGKGKSLTVKSALHHLHGLLMSPPVDTKSRSNEIFEALQELDLRGT